MGEGLPHIAKRRGNAHQKIRIPLRRMDELKAPRILQFSLKSDEIEDPSKGRGISGGNPFVFPLLQIVGDELVDGLPGKLDIGVAKEGHQIISLGALQGVLEIQEVKIIILEDQIAALVIPMGETDGRGEDLLRDRSRLFPKDLFLILGDPDLKAVFDAVFEKMIEFPVEEGLVEAAMESDATLVRPFSGFFLQ